MPPGGSMDTDMIYNSYLAINHRITKNLTITEKNEFRF
jgi:hypothetical protein